MGMSFSANTSYSNEIFKQNILKIATSIIWKDGDKANKMDPADSNALYRIELFIMANRGLLSWDIIQAFPRVVLENCPLPASEIDRYTTDKRLIPEQFRDIVVNEYAKALAGKNPSTGHYMYYDRNAGEYVQVYEEVNEYYRELAGLPPRLADPDEYVFNTDPRWDTTTPIHQLPLAIRYEMEEEGVLEDLIKANPTKKYLQFCGRKAIDLYRSRSAGKFEILYKDATDSDTFDKDFLEAYNRGRALVEAVYYSTVMRDQNEYYDNFMAMSILFMAIEAMQDIYLKKDTSRDFYDVESFKVVYSSYGVPFYSEIPLEYHKRIVKNINQLISVKGSSQVFLDLFKIFDYADMELNQYYLVKEHKLDENGIPTFIIKKDEDNNDMYDEEGNPILDESNYEVHFAKAGLYDDPALAVSNKDNELPYSQMVITDPYWVDNDPMLKQKINEEGFNYLETKYIGVQTVMDLMKITFENAYIFRMITDRKNDTMNVPIDLGDMGISASVYDLFIYLAFLYCMQYGYVCNIREWLEPDTLMPTLGYDFDNTILRVRESLEANSYIHENARLKELILNMNTRSIDGLNTSYDGIMEMRDIIYTGYCNARTKEEFEVYRDLYNTLLVSNESRAVYTDPSTGEVFETFQDILEYYNYDLLNRYLTQVGHNGIETEMTIITSILEKTLTSMRYLPFSVGLTSNRVIDSLFSVLQFFKSAKAELIGYAITYVITSRGVSFFKLLDEVKQGDSEYHVRDSQFIIDILRLWNNALRIRNDLIDLSDMTTDQYISYFLKDQIRTLTDRVVAYTIYLDKKYRDNIFSIDFLRGASENTERIGSKLMLGDSPSLEMTKLVAVANRYEEKYRDPLTMSEKIKLANLVYRPKDDASHNLEEETSFKDRLYINTIYGYQPVT